MCRERPVPTVLPDRMAINRQLAIPRLDVIEYRHRLGADNGKPPLTIWIETRCKQMAAQSARKTHVHMREIAEVVQKCCPLPANINWRRAGNRKDHRQVVRGQIPQSIAFGVELAQPKTVRVDVFDRSQLTGVDQLLEFLEGGMKAQDMADHENAVPGASRRHRALSVRYIERDRLFNEHVLAAFDGANSSISMVLRRQCHDDRVNILTLKQLIGRNRKALLFAGEALRPSRIGIRDGVQGAKRFQRADVIGTPIAASEDGDTRFHGPCDRRSLTGDIILRLPELNPANAKRHEFDGVSAISR